MSIDELMELGAGGIRYILTRDEWASVCTAYRELELQISKLIVESTMRTEVRVFAQAMEERLEANRHKGHWRDCKRGYLLERMREEISELVNAMEFEHASPDVVIKEAADVANFCMMLADNYSRECRNPSASNGVLHE